MENIVSLALYTQDVRDTIKSNEPIDTNNLPMVNSILFHEGTEEFNNVINVSEQEKTVFIKAVEDTIRSKILNQDIQIEPFAEISVKWCCDNNVDINNFIVNLRRTMPDVKLQRYTKEKETEAIKHYLNKTIEQMKNTNSDKTVSNDNNGMSLKEKYCEAAKSRENTHEWVIERFKEDIRILINIISGPVVNAIQLEVPFVANITDIIDKIRLFLI